MTRHRFAALLATGTLLTSATPAGATHSGCEWGVALDVDPQRPEPVRVRVGPFFWFCPGPVLSVRVGPGTTDEPADPTDRGVPEERAPLRLEIAPRTIRAGRAAHLRLRSLWIGPPDTPAGGVSVRFAGREVHLGASGEARVRILPRRAGRLTATADEATATVRVLPARPRRQVSRSAAGSASSRVAPRARATRDRER